MKLVTACPPGAHAVTLAVMLAAHPVPLGQPPAAAGAYPVVRCPVIARSPRTPVAGYPDMAPADPVPIAAQPDIACSRRDADDFFLRRWRLHHYGLTDISRSRRHHASSDRERGQQQRPDQGLECSSSHHAFSTTRLHILPINAQQPAGMT